MVLLSSQTDLIRSVYRRFKRKYESVSQLIKTKMISIRAFQLRTLQCFEDYCLTFISRLDLMKGERNNTTFCMKTKMRLAAFVALATDVISFHLSLANFIKGHQIPFSKTELGQHSELGKRLNIFYQMVSSQRWCLKNNRYKKLAILLDSLSNLVACLNSTRKLDISLVTGSAKHDSGTEMAKMVLAAL